MLEAIIMAVYVFILAPVFYAIHVPPVLILFGMAIVIIPGVYAMITGAPYVPTRNKTVQKMISLAELTSGMRVYDVGCGDGRIVRAAAKDGADAVGIEFSVPTYLVAKVLSSTTPRAQIVYGNFWKQSFADADVIFCFLLIDSMERFYQEIWPQLKPGTKVVSHIFKMKELQPHKKIDRVAVYIKK